jgi:phenylpropionate dioxygenase-like ring-hydroxylating dioxygenase large terminal subunit
VVHLPFIHRTTIGRGNKTLVNGPVVTLENDLLTFYVNNVEDDGKTIPLKPNEITDYQNLFHLQFHYPNIWQNFITDKIRAFAAFVPVDEENTIIYIRYYQRMIRIPLLKELFNYIGKISSIIILRQDKRIVVTQIPSKSEFSMDERLIMGDKPIVEYRRHRHHLMETNNPVSELS